MEVQPWNWPKSEINFHKKRFPIAHGKSRGLIHFYSHGIWFRYTMLHGYYRNLPKNKIKFKPVNS